MITWTGEIFVIGIRIAAPALAALFITQVALGLLARVAPQMNVFMLSFPLNIAIGLLMFSVGTADDYEVFSSMRFEARATTI